METPQAQENSWFKIQDLEILEVELTTFCNARCPLCSRQVFSTYKEDPTLPKRHMDTKDVLSLLPSLAKCKQVHVDFIGSFGDPIMHPELLEICERYLELPNVTVMIETNASVRGDSFWQDLGRLSALSERLKVSFSIDGLADTNRIYRANTDFDKIMRNAKEYLSQGGWGAWKFICFKHNQHQFDEAKDLAQAMGFQRFVFQHSPRWQALKHPIEGTPFVLEPSDVARENLEQMKFMLKEESGIQCRSLERVMLFLNYRFELWPCSYFSVERERNKRFGPYWKAMSQKYGEGFNSLYNTSIEDLLEHPYFQKTLPQSWKSRENYTPICGQFCGGVNYWRKTKQVYSLQGGSL